MRRRDFIAGIGSAAARPLVAQAQQGAGVRRIGVFSGPSENDPINQGRIGAFRKSLASLGRVEGRNLHIDYRYNTANPASDSAELVALTPEVILSTPPALPSLQQASRTIPIVFVLALDPVAEGFVANLARPGGSMTGFAGWDPVNLTKHFQLLQDVAPNINRVLYIYNPVVPGIAKLIEAAISMVPSLVVDFRAAPVRSAAEIERTIDALAKEPNGALIVPSNPVINSNLELIHSLAERYRMPTIGVYRLFPATGGLMSYGFDDTDQYRDAAFYVDRILKGAKPGELPVQYPSKYQLVINLKVAKTLGLVISRDMLSIADEVIE